MPTRAASGRRARGLCEPLEELAEDPVHQLLVLLDEGLEPWSVPEVWVMAHPHPNTFIDITDVFDDKIAAICAHASQLENPGEMRDRVAMWMGMQAQAGGLAEGRLAEAFMIVST